MHQLKLTFLTGLLVSTIAGCAGDRGADGAMGADGVPGAAGAASVVTITDESAGANCAAGGQRIDIGVDNGDGGGTAGNGMLEAGEIDSTNYVCDGSGGASGTESLVNVTAEAAGANCTAGGQRIDVGLDNGDGGGTAGNGTLEAGEIDQTSYVCAGVTSLVSVTSEPPSANCVYGGQRIDVGLDNGDGGGTANNSTLESGEIDDTEYVCHGCLPNQGVSQTFTPNGTAATGTLQMFTVPDGVCEVTITAQGAKGGVGVTEGARIRGTFGVLSGEQISILVGQRGSTNGAVGVDVFGGGGTFVVDGNGDPLVVAGGGGSCFGTCPASTETVGRVETSGGTAGATPRSDNGAGGTAANSTSGGGGGFLTDGANAGGLAYANGGAGGSSITSGGYGGGGARSGSFGQGGGGGYSGGSCGDMANSWLGCGGGGSFNGGTDQLNEAGVNTGDGSVEITW